MRIFLASFLTLFFLYQGTPSASDKQDIISIGQSGAGDYSVGSLSWQFAYPNNGFTYVGTNKDLNECTILPAAVLSYPIAYPSSLKSRGDGAGILDFSNTGNAFPFLKAEMLSVRNIFPNADIVINFGGMQLVANSTHVNSSGHLASDYTPMTSSDLDLFLIGVGPTPILLAKTPMNNGVLAYDFGDANSCFEEQLVFQTHGTGFQLTPLVNLTTMPSGLTLDAQATVEDLRDAIETDTTGKNLSYCLKMPTPTTYWPINFDVKVPLNVDWGLHTAEAYITTDANGCGSSFDDFR
ncbi:hypothetical protein KFE96_10850 [Kordiimonas sp. SCSIO 12603]|uniref:hypothetical protein n=1 Tax=Kordiimonas sp. SCSIO 12603 TaxID=2829596 RepID=UPI00210441E3|nr:hypothetical protein [Kordiimonas sp. SCSIO 12603]UTW57356.1 hypothetical protein KFE96_10850 [Kordiimonas sp. SCSIO 12603]